MKKYYRPSEKERLCIAATEREKIFAARHRGCEREIINRFYQHLNENPCPENTWQAFLFAVQPKKGETKIIADATECFVLKKDFPADILPTDFKRIFKEVRTFAGNAQKASLGAF